MLAQILKSLFSSIPHIDIDWWCDLKIRNSMFKMHRYCLKHVIYKYGFIFISSLFIISIPLKNT